MTCSSSVGLVIRCNITPRHSSKVSSEDKLSVVTLMQGDMVGRTRDASPVFPAVATHLPALVVAECVRADCSLVEDQRHFLL